MTLTIELSPEQEASLAVAARRKGIQPSEIIHGLVIDNLPSFNSPIEPEPAMTPEQRIRAMDALAEQSRTLPALPDEAFDRENLY